MLKKPDRKMRATADAAAEIEAAARRMLDARIGRIVGRVGEDRLGPGFNRKEKRRAAKRVAIIMLPGGGMIDCMIEDLSANGFRIELAAPAAAPLRFALYVPTLQKRFIVARRWVGEKAIGVEIRRIIELEPAPGAE